MMDVALYSINVKECIAAAVLLGAKLILMVFIACK